MTVALAIPPLGLLQITSDVRERSRGDLEMLFLERCQKAASDHKAPLGSPCGIMFFIQVVSQF
jgi:hypothetical protein